MKDRSVAGAEPQENAVRLNSHQRRLLGDLEEIAALGRLDYASIQAYDPEERTARLKFMKNQLIRSQVIMDYTFVDEMLGTAICRYFFGRKKGFIKLWKTKRFRTFNHYILEVLSLSEKVRLVKAIAKVPKAIAANIEALTVTHCATGSLTRSSLRTCVRQSRSTKGRPSSPSKGSRSSSPI